MNGRTFSTALTAMMASCPRVAPAITRRAHARLILAAILTGFFASAADVPAASSTWTGGGTDANWQTSGNWTPATPVASGTLVFAGTTRLATTNNFAANTLFDGITFNSGAGAFVLGGAAVNLGGDITNNSTTTQTITLPLALTAVRNLNTATGNLVISGVISGAFALQKEGTATLTLSGSNSYTGTTTISAGLLKLSARNTLPTSNNVVMGTTGTLDLAGFAQTLSTLTPTTNTAGSAGTVTSSAAGGVLTLSPATGNTFAQVLFTGQLGLVIRAGVDVSSSLNQIQSLNTSDSFTGGLTVQGTSGTLTASSLLAAGSFTDTTGAGFRTSTAAALGSGTITLDNGELFLLSGVATVTNVISITADGGILHTEQASPGVTYSGAINDAGGLLLLSNKSGLATTFSGSMAGFSGTIALDTSTNEILNLSGSATGNANTDLLFSATGTLSKVEWTGTTNPTVSFGELSSGNGSGTQGLVTSNVATTVTYQIGDSTTNAPAFGGSITNGSTYNTMIVALTKTGTNTQTLSGSNTYSGTTTIKSGTLIVDGTHAPSVITGLDAGTYTVSSGATLGGTGTITPATSATGTTAMLTVSGILAPGDPAQNSGIGTLVLSGTNSTKPLLNLGTGATLSFTLGANLTGDAIAITNGQSNDVVFHTNTINFTDLTSGKLINGDYVIFNGDANTTYSGLTTDTNGNITAGLSLGSGLSSYPGTQLAVIGNDVVLKLVSPYSALVFPDTLQFGNTTAELSHSLSSAGTVLDTAGGLGQTCRHITPNTFLTFTVAVNPSAANYLTVKLWGSDTDTNTIYPYHTGATTSLPSSNHYGFYNTIDGVYDDIMAPIYFNLSGVAPFPGRFYYVTLLIPPELIDAANGTATIQLGAVGSLSPYAAAGSQETAPTGQTVGIYSVYTSANPYFNPVGETQGTAPTALTPTAPPAVSSVISSLESSLTTGITTLAGWEIYGSAWTGTNTYLVGAIYQGNNASSPPTLDQIAIQVSNGNLVNLRIPSYLAKAYVTPWSPHYHDATYLDQVVKILDFCCLMQGSNGGLSGPNGWIGAQPGNTTRQVGGSPLEGYGSQGLGLAFTLLYAEAQSNAAVNTALQNYLSQTIQSDGVDNVPRSQAWAALFNNNVQYLLANRGHATNQDEAQIIAMWLENQAANELGSSSALPTSTALQYVYSAVGLAPTPLDSTPSLAGYWYSPNSLPMEPWGTLGGGYDGNYGDVNCLEGLSYLAQLTGDSKVMQQAINAIHGSAHFFYPATGDTGYSSCRKEEMLSTRSLEWPGREDFMNNGMPFAASPTGLNDPIALRFTQLAYQTNNLITILPSNNAHYVDSVGYALLNVDSYNSALQAPTSSALLPTEPGQPNFAWADPGGCTVAAQQTTSTGDIDRLYIEFQWRRGFSSSTERDATTEQVDNIARIHFTTPTIDRVSTATMTSSGFGGVYACNYGSYYVATNLNASATGTTTVPSSLWGQVGTNMVTQTSYLIPTNGVISVTNGAPLVFTPVSGPVAVTAASSLLAGSETSSTLSVGAADNSGTSGLTYTWSTVGTPPAPVTLSVNGTGAAATTTANFSRAGVYNFLVTIQDSTGATTTSTAAVTVGQVFTSLSVTPVSPSIATGAKQQFAATALDQFGQTLTTQPSFTWSLASGEGSIAAATGIYSAPSTSGSATVEATDGMLSGTAAITIAAPPIGSGEMSLATLVLVSDGNGGQSAMLKESSSVVGHTYQMQYREDLMTGQWTNSGTPVAGTGSAIECVAPVASSGPHCFYRIQIQTQ